MNNADIIRRYKRLSRKQDTLFAALDRALSVFLGKPKQAQTLPKPRKLLICNFGHLGDLMITSSLLPALKKAFPELYVGFLCGTWGKPIVEGTCFIDRVHYLDHWHLDRRQLPLYRKMFVYLWRSRCVVREIQAQDYDSAIAIRPWFPNAVPLMWRAQIPIRLGYRKGGFTPLLSHCLEFAYDRWHERDYQASLLRCLPADQGLWQAVPARWMVTKKEGREEAASYLRLASVERYAVLHPSASHELKNWTDEGWRQLARRIAEDGLTPVFTGLGAQQSALIERLIAGGPGVSLCDLSWQGLAGLVEGAEIVYCVDTSVGHLASALGIPCVALLGGMTDPLQWKPLGRSAAIVSHPVPCNPCFDKRGCEHLSCLKKISAEEVWQSGRLLLDDRQRSTSQN